MKNYEYNQEKNSIPLTSKVASLIPKSLIFPFSLRNKLNRLQVIAKQDFSLPVTEQRFFAVDIFSVVRSCKVAGEVIVMKKELNNMI